MPARYIDPQATTGRPWSIARRNASAGGSQTMPPPRRLRSSSGSRERTGSASEIVTLPYDQAYAPGFEDMQRRVPDIAKLQRVIGYAPSVGLAEIIDRVAEYQRQSPGFV